MTCQRIEGSESSSQFMTDASGFGTCRFCGWVAIYYVPPYLGHLNRSTSFVLKAVGSLVQEWQAYRKILIYASEPHDNRFRPKKEVTVT
jgi:hypothetical protein